MTDSNKNNPVPNPSDIDKGFHYHFSYLKELCKANGYEGDETHKEMIAFLESKGEVKAIDRGNDNLYLLKDLRENPTVQRALKESLGSSSSMPIDILDSSDSDTCEIVLVEKRDSKNKISNDENINEKK